MKKLKLFSLLFFLAFTATQAQKLTQTIRGSVKDHDGKFPLIGANIIVLDATPIKGTSVDVDGNFRFDNMPMGRVNLKLSYTGYEDRYI